MGKKKKEMKRQVIDVENIGVKKITAVETF